MGTQPSPGTHQQRTRAAVPAGDEAGGEGGEGAEVGGYWQRLPGRRQVTTQWVRTVLVRQLISQIHAIA